MSGEVLYAVEVDLSVARHRGRHRGEHPAERCAAGARWSHVTRLARRLVDELGDRSGQSVGLAERADERRALVTTAKADADGDVGDLDRPGQPVAGNPPVDLLVPDKDELLVREHPERSGRV